MTASPVYIPDLTPPRAASQEAAFFDRYRAKMNLSVVYRD